jgi:hypothetical protein
VLFELHAENSTTFFTLLNARSSIIRDALQALAGTHALAIASAELHTLQSSILGM